jgi:hypothetical protein
MTAYGTPRAELRLAGAVWLVGAVALGVGLQMRGDPFRCTIQVEGALQLGVLGLLLAMLHGFSFRDALVVDAPIVAIGLVSVLAHHYNPALLGVVLLQLGVLGAARALLFPAATRLLFPRRVSRTA